MSGLRVLVDGVALAQPMGGVLRHAREVLPRLAEMLARQGGELVLLEGRQRVELDLEPHGARIAAPIPIAPAAARALRESACLAQVLARARAQGRPFDVLHTGHLPVPLGLGIAGVLLLHDVKALAAGPAARAMGHGALAQAAREMRAIVVVSRALGEELAARVSIDPGKIVAVGHGADHLARVQRSNRPRAPIAVVAHVEPRKNIRILIEALALDPGLPDLEIAGSARAEHRSELERRAAELGVASRVRFLGQLDDGALSALYARAGALAMPSLREGFGIPVLEAQRAGVPVAIADTAVLREVAGEASERFDPRDARGCARALTRALGMDAERVARAQARAEGFTWQRSAEALLAVWHGVRRP